MKWEGRGRESLAAGGARAAELWTRGAAVGHAGCQVRGLERAPGKEEEGREARARPSLCHRRKGHLTFWLCSRVYGFQPLRFCHAFCAAQASLGIALGVGPLFGVKKDLAKSQLDLYVAGARLFSRRLFPRRAPPCRLSPFPPSEHLWSLPASILILASHSFLSHGQRPRGTPRAGPPTLLRAGGIPRGLPVLCSLLRGASASLRRQEDSRC